jgi:hypothetical protein
VWWLFRTILLGNVTSVMLFSLLYPSYGWRADSGGSTNMINKRLTAQDRVRGLPGS